MKISIITTVYKAEKDLPRLLESMMAQKNPQLEFFLIVNGSPDRCEEICQEYAQKDKRFKIYVIEDNIGYVRARNLGIKECDGDYVGFCDSDDYLEPGGYDHAVNVLRSTCCDLYISAYNVVSGIHITKEVPPYENGLYTGQAMINGLIPQAFGRLPNKPALPGFAWRQIFRRKLFVDYNLAYLPEFQPNEDQILNIDFMSHCKAVYVDNNIIYNYVVNRDSITARGAINFDPDKSWRDLLRFYQEKKKRAITEQMLEACSNQMLDAIYWLFLNIAKQSQHTVEQQTRWITQNIAPETVSEILEHTSKDFGMTNCFFKWALAHSYYYMLILSMRAGIRLKRGIMSWIRII